MFKIRFCVLASLFLAVLGAASASAGDSRQSTFEYSTTIGPIPVGQGPVHVFVPLAAQTEQQQIVAEEIEASISGAIETETAYGNRYWHGQVDRSDGKPIELRVKTTARRLVSRVLPPASSRAVSDAERQDLAKFLGPNSRVVIGHPILEPIRAEVRAAAATADPAALSRAIYDWVIDNVEYKKVGSGWGNGDTFWACNERYGNCTDFHALFISLARSEGIPARFEIGFPLPLDRAEGVVSGYHCWVEFYLPEVGWFPIDASEAFKHPEKREFYYGTHAADRIHFTTGRDLKLGDDHATKPLNYFVYPHIEVGGERWTGPVEKDFRYSAGGEDRPPGQAPGGAGT